MLSTVRVITISVMIPSVIIMSVIYKWLLTSLRRFFYWIMSTHFKYESVMGPDPYDIMTSKSSSWHQHWNVWHLFPDDKETHLWPETCWAAVTACMTACMTAVTSWHRVSSLTWGLGNNPSGPGQLVQNFSQIVISLIASHHGQGEIFCLLGTCIND